MSRRARLWTLLFASILAVRTITGGPTPTASAAAPFAAVPTGGEKPDLVVEVQKAPVAGQFAFVVRNAGSADAHSSRLKVGCEDVFKAPALACAGTSDLIDIPPIPRGGSFRTPDRVITTADASAVPPGPPYYRLRITAEADAEGKISESNERNNTAQVVLENFQGSMPPLSVSQGNGGVSPGLTPTVGTRPLAQVGPQMTIEAEQPLTFDAPDWILVKNKGPADYGGGSAVLLSCALVKRVGGSEVPCNTNFNGIPLGVYPNLNTSLIPVSPLKAGSFQGLFQLPASTAPPGIQGLYRARLVFRLRTGNSHQDFKILSQ